MPIERRTLIGLAALSAAGLAGRARAATLPDLAFLTGERAFGSPRAAVTVQEYFSMTCSHCAAFSRDVMPQITEKLVAPGKLRFVYHDYPLDQIALTGAMVARALPVDRYEPFVSALFASQDRWAFNPDGGNATEALARMAALAGLARPEFDAVVADDGLKQAILDGQKQATDRYRIEATPTFLCNGRTHSGEMDYATFLGFTGAQA